MSILNTKNTVKIFIFIAIALVIGLMAWKIYWLEASATSQSLWREYDTTRINNLKGCIKNQDTECPEGKYAESEAAMQRIIEHESSLLFSK